MKMKPVGGAVTGLSAYEEALADCKYAESLSRTAVLSHIEIWLTSDDIETDYDHEYLATLIDILSKLDTKECMLK